MAPYMRPHQACDPASFGSIIAETTLLPTQCRSFTGRCMGIVSGWHAQPMTIAEPGTARASGPVELSLSGKLHGTAGDGKDHGLAPAHHPLAKLADTSSQILVVAL
jgi:hypothetical protein